MANDPFSGLNNLPVFQGFDEDERRRAIMQTALQFMTPTQSGHPLVNFTSGIQAGLQSLDQSKAQNEAARQQAFQNVITQQATDADVMRAEAAKQQADTDATFKTGSLEQQEKQWVEEKELRVTKADLQRAEAEWNRRRYPGGPAEGSAGRVTEASIKEETLLAWMQALAQADTTGRYKVVDPNTGKTMLNQALLRVDAYANLMIQTQSAGNENTPMIAANNPSLSGQIRNAMLDIAGTGPEPVGDFSLKALPSDIPKTLEEWQALIDKGPGDPQFQKYYTLIGTSPAVNAYFLSFRDQLKLTGTQGKQ